MNQMVHADVRFIFIRRSMASRVVTLLSALALSGCATFSPDNGMSVAAGVTAATIKKDVVAVRGDEQAGWARDATQRLLRRPLTDLRTNTNAGQWLDIQKAALAGGAASKSPVYTGALGEYNGVILHEAQRVCGGIANAGTAAANTRRAVLCGAQAGALAWGQKFDGGKTGANYKWVEEMFDYQRELGVSAQTVWGIKKTVFNGVDFSTIVITTYAAKHG